MDDDCSLLSIILSVIWAQHLVILSVCLYGCLAAVCLNVCLNLIFISVYILYLYLGYNLAKPDTLSQYFLGYLYLATSPCLSWLDFATLPWPASPCGATTPPPKS